MKSTAQPTPEQNHSQDTQSQQPQPEPTQQFAQPNSGPNLNKIVIAVLSLLVVAGVAWYGYAIWYPQYVVKSFVKDHLGLIRQGQVASAYDQTTVGFKENTTQEEYQDYVEVQGISNSGIPYKITEARPYTNQRNLTEHAEVMFNLTGDTGQVQPVKMYLIKEQGTYKVRLVELPGETNPGSWVGFRYDYEKLDSSSEAEPSVAPQVATSPSPIASPVASPDSTQTDGEWDGYKAVAPQAPASASEWTMVSDDKIENSARVAAEQHFGFVRFMDAKDGNLEKAVAQLHPYFKQKETPKSYGYFLAKIGVVDVLNFSLNTANVDVRYANNTHLAKVAFDLTDYSDADGSPTTERVYIGLAAEAAPGDYIAWQEWKVISMFTDGYIRQNPSFFPY